MNAATFPAPQPVALAVALAWKASPDWTFETKADGKRGLLANGELRGRALRYRLPGELPAALAGCTLDGELVGNVYFAFDVIEADGEDLRRLPLRERGAALKALQSAFPDWIRPIPTARPGQSGSEYLAEVLIRGCEGICAKQLSAPYGVGWLKAKRLETFDVVVTALASTTRSVSIGQYSDDGRLVDCGKVAVFSLSTLESLRTGDVLEIAAQGRTVKGKFREPRFLKGRTDKPAADCVALPSQM